MRWRALGEARLLIVAAYTVLAVAGLVLSAYTPEVVVWETREIPYEGVLVTRPIGATGGAVLVSLRDNTGTRVLAAGPDGAFIVETPYPEAGAYCNGYIVVSGIGVEASLAVASGPKATVYTIDSSVILPRAQAASCNETHTLVLYSPFVTGPSFLLALQPGDPGTASLYRLPGQGWKWMVQEGPRVYIASEEKLAIVEPGGRVTIYRLPENLKVKSLEASPGGPVVLGSYGKAAAALLPGGRMLLLNYTGSDDAAEALAYTSEAPGWASLLVQPRGGSLQYVQVSPSGEATGYDVIIGGAWTRQAAASTGDGGLLLAGVRIRGDEKTLFLAYSQGTVGVPVVVGWPDYIMLVKKTPNQPDATILETGPLQVASTTSLQPVEVTLVEADNARVEMLGWARTAEPRIDRALLLFAAASLAIPPAYAACRILCPNSLNPPSRHEVPGPPPADSRGPRDEE